MAPVAESPQPKNEAAQFLESNNATTGTNHFLSTSNALM
jgi:hypothetical protein